MGLYLVKEITEGLSIKVNVKSTYGEGTTVLLIFPQPNDLTTIEQASDNNVTSNLKCTMNQRKNRKRLYYGIINNFKGVLNMSILKTEQLVKVYGSKKNQQEVLKQIDMTVEKGEFISIMGPSGSGKTTLLNVLSSIDYATTGQIEINGHQLQNMNNRQMSNFRKKSSDLYSKNIICLIRLPCKKILCYH